MAAVAVPAALTLIDENRPHVYRSPFKNIFAFRKPELQFCSQKVCVVEIGIFGLNSRGERRRRDLDFKAHYDCAEWRNIIAEEIVIADFDFKHHRGGEDRTMTAYCYVSIHNGRPIVIRCFLEAALQRR